MARNKSNPLISSHRLTLCLAIFVCTSFVVSLPVSAQENVPSAAPGAYAFTASYDKKEFGALVELVNAGLDVNLRTHGGDTLLTYAASHAEEEAFAVSVARLLLFNGARVNVEDSFGRSALVYAIEEDRKKLAQLLLDNGADVTLSTGAYKMPVVFVPFMHRNVAMARMVISACPDVNIRDAIGNTPLSWASRFGYLDMVSSLLERGARVDNLSVHNKTPLMEAAETGHYGVAVVLVRHGADVDVRTKKGWSALMWSAEKGYEDIVSLLIGADADLFAKNNKGERALAIARKNNHPETVKIIRQAEFRFWLKRILACGAIASVLAIITFFAVRRFRRNRG